MSKYVNKEIDPEDVWNNISEGKTVRAAVLVSTYYEHKNIVRGVYNLEDEAIGNVKDMVKAAEESGNIRFYILEEVKEDNNDVTG